MTTAGPPPIVLEVCVDSDVGAAAAIVGGANRIELCGALETGGLTPSAGLAAAVVARCRDAGVPVHAMVRPRSGDFAYDRDELALAIGEGVALIAEGVDGLVFGACRDGMVDMAVARAWVSAIRAAASGRLALTFHRAIDLVDDPVAAVDVVADLGFAHILTSGGARVAADALPVLHAMVARAGDRVQVIAGSGVRPDTVAALVDATGVPAVHASASAPCADDDPRVAAMGFAVAPRRRTDTAVVVALKNALDSKTNVRQ